MEIVQLGKIDFMNKNKFVIFKVVLLLVIGLCFQSYTFAQEKISMEDKIIGSTFKTLAKTFVVMVDIDKLKKDNINKLNKMDKEKFIKRYAKAYEVIKDLPPELKISYGITENMPKEQAIKNIESFDKKNIYKLIDSIPDTIIAKQFKKYLSEKKEEVQKSSLVAQINKFWNKMVEKVNKPTTK
ncbi:MAG: hypothetical protein NTZ92_00915 [Candidatus Omnitrophica bacterium]|nr:hypothetical protein [Candidatus Omnitrophota bacterium]